ncbi:MAG: FecR family protein [Proteobacteria bacterium]|nr:MAG: FecR family protein [Pseudomonadota bacterium]
MKGNFHPDNDLPVAERIAYLIAGFLRGTLTEAEHNELDAWVVASEENTRLFEHLTDETTIAEGLRWKEHLNEEAALQSIKARIGSPRKSRFRLLLPLSIAASLLVAIGIFFFTRTTPQPPPVAQDKGGIQPGKDQAVLTLAGGRTIILDSAGSGMLANERGVDIAKESAGGIRYAGAGGTDLYQTLSIPRGGQYRLVLGDGTRVWLNAESSLRFPASFADSGRTVELQGEAYFEVAKDAGRPFRVAVRTRFGTPQTVEVLGTHFNINGYGDDSSIRTTLLEGSVRVRHGPSYVMLRPGQAARGSANGGLQVEKGDPSATAWKDGLFRFRGATIQTIAAQISRWYDIDVQIRGNIPDHFNATIDRKEPLQDLLQVLQETHRVRFTLEGKKLIITP